MDHLPGLLASVLLPLIVLLGFGLVAVARRIHRDDNAGQKTIERNCSNG